MTQKIRPEHQPPVRSVTTGYCTEPCSGCPWRMDTAMSIMPEAEALCGSDSRPLLPGDPMMPCHKKPRDADQNLCAAWLALFGWHHLKVRMMVGAGLISVDALEPKPEWPPLHPNVSSIIQTHGRPEEDK